MNTGTPYQRLPGSAGLIMRKRLWLGPDHILLVSSHLLSHEYRRFYFGDIQALVVAEVENPARFYGGVLSVMAVAFTLGLAVAGHPFLAVFCGVIGIGLAIFTLTRPLVRCSLKTQVSNQLLPSLKRLETARYVVALIRAEIEKIQGPIPADLLTVHPHVDGPTIPPQLRPYKGGIHWAAFATMFVVTLLTPLRLNFPSVALANTLAGAHISMVLLAVIAAVKQHASGTGRAARTVIALTLAWTAASFVTEQIIVASTIQAAFRNPMSFDYWRDPIWDVAVANAIAYAVFGLIGVFALISQHRPAPAL